MEEKRVLGEREERKIVELYAAGRGCPAIAAELGIGRLTIYRFLREQGMNRDYRQAGRCWQRMYWRCVEVVESRGGLED